MIEHTMKNIIVKFLPVMGRGEFSVLNGTPIKVLFGEKTNDIKVITGYRSRSGAHYDIAYIVREDGEEIMLEEFKGMVRTLYTILQYRPMTYNDILKPIPREGKNCVILCGMTFKEFCKKLAIEAIKPVESKENIMIWMTEEGISVHIVELYDYRIFINPYDNQGNLLIYTAMLPYRFVKFINDSYEYIDRFIVGRHTVLLDVSAPVAIARKVTKRSEVEVSVLPNYGGHITLVHPEHGVKSLVLPFASYVFIHPRIFKMPE